MMIHTRLLSVLAIALMAATSSFAQDYTHPKEMGLPETGYDRPDPDGMRVELPSGLAAYVAVDARAPLVTLSAFVAVGSAHGAPGDAELVAAALRRGPASLPDGEFQSRLRRLTAEYSVSVGREETEITLDVPAEDAWEAIELMADLLREPAFGAAGAGGTGRRAQAEGIDWASSIAGAIDAFEARLFSGHAYGRAPSQADMEAARGGRAQAFYRLHFVPANAAIALTGDFEIAQAKARLQQAFEDWSGGDRPAPSSFGDVKTASTRQVLLADAAKLQGWVVIGHELPVVPPEDEAALHVMDYILGAYHLDSRLFRESRELRGLTNDNSSFLLPGVRGPGSYQFRTYGRPEVVELLIDLTFRELAKIRDTQPTADELFVAKGALVDGLWAAQYATGRDAARSYAIEWVREGSHAWSLSYPDRIAEVTAEDVQQAAQRYIHPDRMIVAVVGPLDAIEAAPPIESEPALGTWGAVERF